MVLGFNFERWREMIMNETHLLQNHEHNEESKLEDLRANNLSLKTWIEDLKIWRFRLNNLETHPI